MSAKAAKAAAALLGGKRERSGKTGETPEGKQKKEATEGDLAERYLGEGGNDMEMNPEAEEGTREDKGDQEKKDGDEKAGGGAALEPDFEDAAETMAAEMMADREEGGVSTISPGTCGTRLGELALDLRVTMIVGGARTPLGRGTASSTEQLPKIVEGSRAEQVMEGTKKLQIALDPKVHKRILVTDMRPKGWSMLIKTLQELHERKPPIPVDLFILQEYAETPGNANRFQSALDCFCTYGGSAKKAWENYYVAHKFIDKGFTISYTAKFGVATVMKRLMIVHVTSGTKYDVLNSAMTRGKVLDVSSIIGGESQQAWLDYRDDNKEFIRDKIDSIKEKIPDVKIRRGRSPGTTKEVKRWRTTFAYEAVHADEFEEILTDGLENELDTFMALGEAMDKGDVKRIDGAIPALSSFQKKIGRIPHIFLLGGGKALFEGGVFTAPFLKVSISLHNIEYRHDGDSQIREIMELNGDAWGVRRFQLSANAATITAGAAQSEKVTIRATGFPLSFSEAEVFQILKLAMEEVRGGVTLGRDNLEVAVKKNRFQESEAPKLTFSKAAADSFMGHFGSVGLDIAWNGKEASIRFDIPGAFVTENPLAIEASTEELRQWGYHKESSEERGAGPVGVSNAGDGGG